MGHVDIVERLIRYGGENLLMAENDVRVCVCVLLCDCVAVCLCLYV